MAPSHNYRSLLALASLVGASGLLSAQSAESVDSAAAPAEQLEIPWTRRTVEHLYNRAGFGVGLHEIRAALARTPADVVDELLTGGRRVAPPHVEQGTAEDLRQGNDLERSERRRVKAQQSKADRRQLFQYSNWWLDRMVAHDDPLRDRMTLFWHGLFTSSHETVKRSYDMIQQHQLLRDNAIESYATMLQGIVVDPAMLLYLDNSSNKKGNPNENLARELLELFSLGEGNYSEEDVREVARALTGHTRDRLGNYRFHPKSHDRGEKTILGSSGPFDAKGVCRILLAQESCARYIAARIIAYFEGMEPSEARLEEYADHLRSEGYALKPFLRKLLLDPGFYREEVIGTRVQSPVDFLVSNARRLGLDVDSRALYLGASSLGQRLFYPPSVKGWDEGESWITTGSFLMRGNIAGMMLGTVDVDAAFGLDSAGDGMRRRGARKGRSDADSEVMVELDDEYVDSMEETMNDGFSMGDEATMGGASSDDARGTKKKLPKGIGPLATAIGDDYAPAVNFTWRLRQAKAKTDAKIVGLMLDELLAIKAPRDTRARVLAQLRREREAADLSEAEFLKSPDLAEPILRRLAHIILSLPEAQLG